MTWIKISKYTLKTALYDTLYTSFFWPEKRGKRHPRYKIKYIILNRYCINYPSTQRAKINIQVGKKCFCGVFRYVFKDNISRFPGFLCIK